MDSGITIEIFSFFTLWIESEGIGARSVLSRLRLCNAQPAYENCRKYSMVQLANRRTVSVRPQIIEYEQRNR